MGFFMAMRHCFLGLYEKALPDELSWRERLLAAKEAGYDFMEISIDETDGRMARLHWSGEEARKLMRDILETGTPLLTMCLSGNRRFPIGSEDKACRARGVALIKDAVDFSLRFGVRVVQLAGYDEFYGPRGPATERLFLESLREVVHYAACRGVILAIENVETPFMNTISKMQRYVERVNSPWLRLYPDIGNLTAAGLTTEEIHAEIRGARESIVAFHVKDTLPGVIRGVPYEEGTVDFDDFFSFLETEGFQGLLVAEMWSDQSPASMAYPGKVQRLLREKINTSMRKELSHGNYKR